MERKDENRNTISEFDAQPDAQPAEQSAEAPASSAGGESGPDQQSVLEQKERELSLKSEEIQTLQDKLLRLAAEFENYKRLAQRDQREQVKFANETLLKELLPIVDNLERAINFAKGTASCDALIQGVELTLKQFLEALNKFGVRQITSIGEPFDPSRHQAVAHVESKEVAENTVVEEYQKGYLLHDRVMRAAMVAVAAPGKGSDGNPVEGDEPRGNGTSQQTG